MCSIYTVAFVICVIFLTQPIRKSNLYEKDVCGHIYTIVKGHNVICSKNFNGIDIIVDDRTSVVCGNYVITYIGAYDRISIDKSFIYNTLYGVYSLEIINGHKSKVKIENNVKLTNKLGFSAIVINNKIDHYICDSHCDTKLGCFPNNIYYI